MHCGDELHPGNLKRSRDIISQICKLGFTQKVMLRYACCLVKRRQAVLNTDQVPMQSKMSSKACDTLRSKSVCTCKSV